MPLSISIAVMQSLSKYYRPHFLGENDIWRLLINALSFKDLFRVKIGARYNFLPGLGNTPPHVAIRVFLLVSLCLLPTNQKRRNIHIINFLFRTNLNLPIFLAHLQQYRLVFLSRLSIITTFFFLFFLLLNHVAKFNKNLVTNILDKRLSNLFKRKTS